MEKDTRFKFEAGWEYYTGSELVVKGILESESAVNLATGCPDTPVGEFFKRCEELEPLLAGCGVGYRPGQTSGLAAAQLAGSRQAGRRGVGLFSQRGFLEAAEEVRQMIVGPAGAGAGTLVICSEGPSAYPGSAPEEGRMLFQHLDLPFLQPSSAQELKDWVDAGLKLSIRGRCCVGMRIAVSLAEGGATVIVKRNMTAEPDSPAGAEGAAGQGVTAEAVGSILAEARRMGINRIVNRPQKGEAMRLGFIASGIGYAYLMQALWELGLGTTMPVLKLGLAFPLDEGLIEQMAHHCDQLVVVEEGRSFLESQVNHLIAAARQRGVLQTQVWGKRLPDERPGIPAHARLSPSLLIERLGVLLREHPMVPLELLDARLQAAEKRSERAGKIQVRVARPEQTFCSGCPQRVAWSVLGDVQSKLLDSAYTHERYKTGPVELTIGSDGGCNALLPQQPGSSARPGVGHGGLSLPGLEEETGKRVVFMGFDTFMMGGQQTIRRSIAMKQEITYILVDNRRLSPRPGDAKPDQVEEVHRAAMALVPGRQEKVARVARIRPGQRAALGNLLRRQIMMSRVNIILIDQECGRIVSYRKAAQERLQIIRAGYVAKKQVMNVAEQVCEFCLQCTSRTGCPGLKTVGTEYGVKIQTDLDWCENDKVCSRLEVCPAFEQVEIRRMQPARPAGAGLDLRNLPEPAKPVHAGRDVWRGLICGLGGQGAGLCGRILVAAGRVMGYRILTRRYGGTAVRTGPVYEQVLFTRFANSDHVTSAMPWGQADLLLGLDLEQTARSMDDSMGLRPAGPETAAVVNRAENLSTLRLTAGRKYDEAGLLGMLKACVGEGRLEVADVSRVSERILGSGKFANAMLLGMAFQKGYLPLTWQAMESGIAAACGEESEANRRAVALGRLLAADPAGWARRVSGRQEALDRLLRRKARVLGMMGGFGGLGGRGRGRAYKFMVVKMVKLMQGAVPEQLLCDLAVRVFDCWIWGGRGYAGEYCRLVKGAFEADEASRGYALTRAVVWNLARAMLIKDEIYVAAMLTNPEKLHADRRRLGVVPSRGDRMKYRRYMHPELSIFGLKIRFEIKAKEWQLRRLGHSRWLRKVMPGWHKREMGFRNWYMELVEERRWKNDGEYEKWLAALSVPEQARGFREVLYPQLKEARARAEEILAGRVAPGDKPAGGGTGPAPNAGGEQAAGADGVLVSLTDRVMNQP